MERRSKTRHDLQLICHIGTGKVLSRPLAAVTSNVSRDGLLMRWLPAVPLPKIGFRLTVEVELPNSDGFGMRFMRCQTRVVRIDRPKTSDSSVALQIEQIRFVDGPATSAIPDLEAMPVANEKPI